MKKHLSRPVELNTYGPTARELLHRVREAGEDVESVVKRACLRWRAATVLAPDWNGPLSRADFARLYAECTWALDAQASRQEGRAPLTKPEFDMLCYCIITCGTLREAVLRAAAFSAMLMPRTARLTLTEDDGIAELRMSTLRGIRNTSAFVSDLTGLATHHRLFGWLIGIDLPLITVLLCYPPLLSSEATWRLMPHEITYNAQDNILQFPAAFLERPVVRNHTELQALLKHFPFDVDEAQAKFVTLTDRIRIVLREAISSASPLPTGAALARRFTISTATLKRRLSDEGTSLRALKDEGRREFAMRLLGSGSLPISEIAVRTGFRDTTAFSRAFRRWTGSAPSHWRGM